MKKEIFIEEIREEVTQCRIIQIDKKLNKIKSEIAMKKEKGDENKSEKE